MFYKSKIKNHLSDATMDEIIKYTSKLKLLYVEDDANTGAFFKTMMEDIFLELILVSNGEDAMKKLQNNDIDLIITDINMPKMDGLEMIQVIRNENQQIPIIILSAHIKPEYFLKSIKLNIKGYLVKPLDIDDLFDILKEICLSIKLQDEIIQQNKTIEQDHKFLQSVIDNSYESVMVIKEDYSVDLMNKAIKNNMDKRYIADINNPKCYEIFHHRTTPCDGREYYCPLKDVIESKNRKTVIHKHFVTDENIRYVEIAAAPLLDENNNCTGMIETSRDITEHIIIQEQLRQQKDILDYKASHDALTGLANRTLFEDRLQQAFFRAKRNNTNCALFFIDLDKFKQINDTFGHKVGDYVLQTLSDTMKNEIREEDLLSRIGGDEFTLVLENINGVENAKNLAFKLLAAIEKPIYYEKNILNVSASIGISLYPQDSTEIQTLLKYADSAMYRAKKSDENIVYFSKMEKI